MSQTPNTPTTPLTYKDAGVDIAAGDELVSRIKSAAKSTARKEVMGGLGGFGVTFCSYARLGAALVRIFLRPGRLLALS